MPLSDATPEEVPTDVPDLPDSGTPSEAEVQASQVNWQRNNELFRAWVFGEDDATIFQPTILAALEVGSVAELAGADGEPGEPGPGSGVVLVWSDTTDQFEPNALKTSDEHKTFYGPPEQSPVTAPGVILHRYDVWRKVTFS